MLKCGVLFEIIMLCASGVAMENYAGFFDVMISQSFSSEFSRMLVMPITGFPGVQQT